ncbi:MAG TPA: GNAT family N-acetyltransferase [candidate division Zixibacteria bacterium]|nr:GNAT family N-acetyltransferase [candidate division Zixibacteria bacterium]
MVEIRLLESDDWQGLFDLIETVDKKMVGMCSESEELVEDWINTIVMGLWEVYVAILPQEEIKKEQKRFIRKILPWKFLKDNPSGIVGLVTLYGDWQEDEDIEEGEYDIGVSVAKPFHRRGLGKKLMSFILQRGKELKFKKATLWTRVDNHSMIILAEKMNFIECGKRTRYGYNWVKYYKEL